MNVKEAIENRRSIRSYQDKAIPEDIISELIEAARLAPSGNNAQPWLYKIISDKKTINMLKDNKIFKQPFVYTAPTIIVCCANPSAYPKKEFVEELDDSNELRAVRDLGLSAQNLVLRATELGIGTCYIGWVNKIKIKEVLNIPKEYIVPYVITIGYAASNPPERIKKEIKDILI